MLPLPNYFNPRISRESRDRYIKYIVPLWMFSSLANASTIYGFNVWVLPITMHTFGDDAIYSMQTGQILYAFSMPILVSVLMMPILATEMVKMGTRQTTLFGLVIYLLGLILGGVSIENNCIWGFWLSISVVSGIGNGMIYYPVAIYSVAWFREIGRPALGSGLTGFFAGFWPAIFSFYCPVIIEKSSVPTSFYYNALIIAVFSIPTLLFQCSPNEVPLIIEGRQAPDDDINSVKEISSSNMKEKEEEEEEEEEKEKDDTTETNGDDTKELSSNIIQKQEEEDTTFKGDVEEQNQQIIIISPMTRLEILSTPQFYIQFLGLFLTMLPGFAIKFNISVFSSALFKTDVKTQSIISFIFLFVYAVSRLFTGLATGRLVSADMAAQLASGIQIPAFIGAALVVILGAKYLWAFVVFQAIIGFGLGAYKVTVTINALSRWSMINFHSASALLVLSFGFAGAIGPMIGWMTLSIPGNVPLDNERAVAILGGSEKETTERIAGIFFFVMAVVSIAGFAINRYAMKAVVQNDENL